MRRAASFLIPITLITLYYAMFIALFALMLIKFPAMRDFFPIGGIGDIAGRSGVGDFGTDGHPSPAGPSAAGGDFWLFFFFRAK